MDVFDMTHWRKQIEAPISGFKVFWLTVTIALLLAAAWLFLGATG